MHRHFAVVPQQFHRHFGIRILLSALLVLGFSSIAGLAQSIVYPGTTWKATNGSVLEAHGAGVIKVGSTYYLIGEDHSTSNSFSGINCYSSTDLVTWTFIADILPPESSGDLVSTAVIQRPKVIYNSTTQTYVMWMHVDNSSYSLNHTGVATSSTVCGTYSYQGSFEPEGYPSYDMGLFQDTNGDAYLLTTDNNVALRIEQLSSNYLSVENISATLPSMEGPSMVKVGSTYYIFCSHLTGWSPNDNEYATASSITGTWSSMQDFAPSGTNTFSSQDTWILTIAGSSGTTYMYMGDRWDSSDLADSTYVWLPLTISGTSVSMAWYNGWNLNISAGTWAAYNGTQPTTGSYKPLIAQNSGLCLSAVNATEGTQLEQVTCNGSSLQQWEMSTEGSGYYVTNEDTGMVADDSGQSKSPGGAVIDWDKNGGANQQWIFRNNGQGYFNVINVYSGLCLDVLNASTSSGALIDQYTCNGGSNQNWEQ